MTPLEWFLASLVVASGALLQGAVGFGMNLVAVPFLLLIEPDLVPGPAIVAAAVLTVLTAMRDRRGLALREISWALVGRVPGSVVAAAVLVAVSETQLALLVAGLVLGSVALSAGGWHLRPDRSTLLVAGAVSGFSATVSSIGGPPMAVLYAREEGVRLRGTLAGFFSIGTLVSIAALVVADRFGTAELGLSVGLVPGAVAGFACSGSVAIWLDAGRTRRAVLVVAALAAVSVVVAELV